jgi:uncharacterized membrane protein YvbJ
MDNVYCTNCGKALKTEDNFCGYCGNKVNAPLHTLLQNSVQNVQQKTSNNKTWILGGGILIVLLILFSLREQSGSPADVTMAFIDHSKNNEWEQAEELWSQEGKDHLVSTLFNDDRWIYQTMKNLVQRTDGTLYEYEIVEQSKKGEHATVLVDFTFDNGRREKHEFTLIKENGEWRIFAFTT